MAIEPDFRSLDQLLADAAAFEDGQEALPELVSPFARVRFDVASFSQVANGLIDVDRESRRTVAYLLGADLRPIRTNWGEFALLYARPGSADLLARAVGEVADVLLSKPLQFVITLGWLWNHVRPARWRAVAGSDTGPGGPPGPQANLSLAVGALQPLIETAAANRARVRLSMHVTPWDIHLEWEQTPFPGEY